MESFRWSGDDMSSNDKDLLHDALEKQLENAEPKDEIAAQLSINPDDHRRQAAFFTNEILRIEGDLIPNKELIDVYKRIERILKQLSAVEDFYNTQAKLFIEEKKIGEGDYSEKVTVISAEPRESSSRELFDSLVRRRADLMDSLDVLEKVVHDQYPEEYTDVSNRVFSEMENRTN